MIAKATKEIDAAMTGAIKNTSLSTPVGTMSSFSGSFSASAIGCSRPKGPGRVGPRPFLHAADPPPLEPDHEDGGEQQEHEDDRDLEQHHPPDERVEVAQRRVQREHMPAHEATSL